MVCSFLSSDNCLFGLDSSLSELANPISWLAWRSLARALSPCSMFRPTETIKLTPILDFIEIGGLVSSVCTGLSLPGGVESLRMIEPCGMLVGNAVRGK